MSRTLIDVKNVSMTFPSGDREIQALDKLSFDIKEGELLTILGPSGCGKSTLLRILAGLLRCTEGEVLYKEETLVGPQRDIAVIFQDPVLLPWRNVISNVMLPVEVLNLDKNTFFKRASSLLKLVGLTGFEEFYPWELSGGMKQRTSLARALVADPSILLMDEPFGGLDAMTREQMNMELLKIRDEAHKTVFFITHSIMEAILLGERVIVLTERPGRIKAIMNISLPNRNKHVVYTREFGDYVQKIEAEIKR